MGLIPNYCCYSHQLFLLRLIIIVRLFTLIILSDYNEYRCLNEGGCGARIRPNSYIVLEVHLALNRKGIVAALSNRDPIYNPIIHKYCLDD